MFENALYPDNPSRAQRAAQLANDCEILASDLGRQKQEIDTAMEEVTEAFRHAFGSIGIPDFQRQQLRVARSWVYDLPAPVAGIVGSVLFERALEQAFTRYLVSQGRIGEAAFARLVGLPKWFKVGKFAGSVAGAMIITLAIQLGIDAVDGAVQRSKLR